MIRNVTTLEGVAYCVLRMRIAYWAFGTGCVLRIAYCTLRILVHCLPAAMGVNSHKRPVNEPGRRYAVRNAHLHPKYGGGKHNTQYALRSVPQNDGALQYAKWTQNTQAPQYAA